jgi:hypothetical protein
MGNIPNMGTDPDGGLCCGDFLISFAGANAQLAEQAISTFFLNEVVVRSTSLSITRALPSLVKALPSLAQAFDRALSFSGGAANAINSNITLGAIPLQNPNGQGFSHDYARGQQAGHIISAAWGIAETYLGILTAGTGGGLTLTGGGAVVGVPLMAAGAGITLHGGAVTARALNNMNKVHNLSMNGGSSASDAALTAQEIISKSRKGSIMRVFPEELLGKTLKEIEKLSKQGGPLGDKAKTALKLLKDGRFKK